MKKRSLSLLFLYVSILTIQTILPQQASADSHYSDLGSNYGKIATMSLSDQIKTYKLTYALGICNQVWSDQISGADATSGKWYTDKAVTASPILGSGTNNGQVKCNDLASQAITLWGITDKTSFLIKAGWQQIDAKDPSKGFRSPKQSSPQNKNGDVPFRSAVANILGSSVDPPSYPVYYSYYDVMSALTSGCGGSPVHDAPLTADDKTNGYSLVSVADPAGSTITQTVYKVDVSKNIHFGAAGALISANGFGDAVNPVGNQYDGKTVSCKSIVGYLNQTNATLYNNTIPTSLAKSTSTPSTPQSNEGNGDNKSSCTIDGIGWIICPVMNFMAKIVDATYSAVSSMLTVQPLTTSSSIYTPWKSMRNFANIVFILAFLIIIYSQITGVGVSNYGIKKLLPKIVITAILVNVSFWLCAIAVDLSNIVGASMNDLIGKSVDISKINFNDSAVATGTGFAGITGGILASAAVGATLYLALGTLAPVLVAALIAIITAFLVLTIRQVLIILMIVISPLAFVAFLLPNTEKWFKKWLDTFKLLLLMYPIIGILFGVSSLASKIIMDSAPQIGNGSKGLTIVIQLMGALAAIIPLALTPMIMKLANGISGLASISGRLNNPNKGPFDRARKKAQSISDNSAWTRGQKTKRALKGSRKDRAFANNFDLGRKISTGEENLRNDGRGNNYSALEVAKRAKALRAYHGAVGPGEIANSTLGKATTLAMNSSNPNIAGMGAYASTALNAATKGSREDISEMSEHFQGVIAKATAEAIRDAVRTMSRDMSVAQGAAMASGKDFDKDTWLEKRVMDAKSTTEANAALQTLGSLGRDGVLRDMQGKAGVDQGALSQAISDNAGSLIGKAPDLVKGKNAAFGSVSGEQLSGFSKGTGEAYMNHLASLHTAAASGGADEIKALNAAVGSFNSAVVDITRSTQLQGKFAGETGTKILNESASLSPGLQSQLYGLASIGTTDGKIR